MTIKRMDNVGIVVEDLAAATAFFVELGLELEGKAPVEGRWAERVVGLDDMRVDIANTLGMRRIMFPVGVAPGWA
jgi:catechol 2,3-dioxygenase-like lactoylglutathione lyase family enzyme